MNISILTVFDQLYEPFLQTSLVRRAQEKNLVHIDVARFSSFVDPKERIDAPTFGPGAGMLIKPEVVQKAVESKEQAYGNAFKVFLSPQGEKLNQRTLERIAHAAQERGHLMLLPARYEGMDARVEEHYADAIVSVGDFVLMGGDLPVMMLLEGMLRLIPQVVGKEESVRYESFTGPFVDYPSYTEPVEWKEYRVPDIVRSGNHAAIEQWRMQQAVQKTVREHFSWMRTQHMTQKQHVVARSCIPRHYVALLHGDVQIGPERETGTTSVTSIDIHDIARSSRTYDIQSFFVVTPLQDQQKIVRKLLGFWQGSFGVEYNIHRHEAIKQVALADDLDGVIDTIEKAEGKKPVIIATAARELGHLDQISFFDQKQVWSLDRPVLFLFGTGRGLSDAVIKRCDFLLLPVQGFSDFNHLSVRSAVAVVLDRWLGINQKEVEKRLAE